MNLLILCIKLPVGLLGLAAVPTRLGHPARSPVQTGSPSSPQKWVASPRCFEVESYTPTSTVSSATSATTPTTSSSTSTSRCKFFKA
eukprot:512640-Amphidinium_carterae.1